MVKAGLLLPRDFSKSKPVPLVIQAYYYRPEYFWPDGSSMTAFAAQALVAQGMAVLFMNIPAVEGLGKTLREGPAFVARIDAAVASLATESYIDSSKVGVIGFSRSGFETSFAITHPGQTKLAAAIIADSFTGSYGEYVMGAATSGAPGDQVGLNYARDMELKNFWEDKARWLEYAPVFNVEKVRTPVLFAYNGSAANFWMLETLGAYRINRKPHEYMSFPQGQHQLQTPRERLASLNATVDWMNFWLQDREDLSESKQVQYERWNKLKSAWRQAHVWRETRTP